LTEKYHIEWNRITSLLLLREEKSIKSYFYKEFMCPFCDSGAQKYIVTVTTFIKYNLTRKNGHRN